MSDTPKPRRGLLPEDHSEIRLVPAAAREIWEPKPPKRSAATQKAQDREIDQWLKHKRKGESPAQTARRLANS